MDSDDSSFSDSFDNSNLEMSQKKRNSKKNQKKNRTSKELDGSRKLLNYISSSKE